MGGEFVGVVANQVHSHVHAGSLRSGVGAQDFGVRVFDQIRGDEAGIGLAEIVDDGQPALGFVDVQQARRQRGNC